MQGCHKIDILNCNLLYNLLLNVAQATFLKEVPSLTRGTDGKERSGFISRKPLLRLYRLLMMIRRSEVVFTGKNLRLGTLTPKIYTIVRHQHTRGLKNTL